MSQPWPRWPRTHATTSASVVAREAGVIDGGDLALIVFDEVLGSDGYRVVHQVLDGTRLEPGGAAALVVEGPTRGFAHRERNMLNVLCHCPVSPRHRCLGGRGSGYAGSDPGPAARHFRACGCLQKYAVREVVGGSTTGWGLGDAALIKDNHVAPRRFGGGGVAQGS